MDAHEREPEPGRVPGSEADRASVHERYPERGPVSMRDLLASCAAADAISTPPASVRNPDDDGPEAPEGPETPETEAA